ncbi:uncharacterized protein BDR25DRAFT_347165 [Lindgomyces ingoldianus]|uniref:Uncharacterized protein n=1 Tax=Lindgomyces ingoldianus TaxID=673940 RepID=A0ACB6Q983_9PLEO|nr:uncharacterized protein BDR25DRAFT_347165 [Lindgomyces ingoldianus]KAF2463513.1 hypothetical protein BDR25DRAFT_347165 [Lindgomyces ingoldianus]
MASSRTYIPSIALLRALSRPGPPKCSFVYRTDIQCRRGKSSQPPKPLKKKTPAQIYHDTLRKAYKATGIEMPKPRKGRAQSYQDMLDMGLSGISYVQMDEHGNEQVIDQIKSEEEFQRWQKRDRMLKEDATNPNYDDTELRKMLLDDLMRHPSFSHLREELQEMKEEQISKEEEERQEKEMEKEVDEEIKDLVTKQKVIMHDSWQEMIDDPDYADAKEMLLDVQSRWAEFDMMSDDPELEAAFQRLTDKLQTIPAFQKKLAESGDRGDAELRELEEMEQQLDKSEEEWSQRKKEEEETEKALASNEGTAEEINILLRQIQELLAAIGGDSELEGELEELLHQDPFKEVQDELDAEFDFEKLAKDISDGLDKLKNAPTPEELEKDENDAELQAKVDKIMDDPKLLEKLAFIKELMKERKRDITQFGGDAPDPATLYKSELTTFGQQLKIAERDPEHLAAIRRLRIHLLPPFNISPALRSLNQALKFAYLGANDDVRRILWRAYSKARTIPTLLQNIPDDAWDMLWYSQAVKWRSNQNRENHLRILLQDLVSVGKDGPPTKPEQLMGQGQPEDVQGENEPTPMEQALELARVAKAEFSSMEAATSVRIPRPAKANSITIHVSNGVTGFVLCISPSPFSQPPLQYLALPLAGRIAAMSSTLIGPVPTLFIPPFSCLNVITSGADPNIYASSTSLFIGNFNGFYKGNNYLKAASDCYPSSTTGLNFWGNYYWSPAYCPQGHTPAFAAAPTAAFQSSGDLITKSLDKSQYIWGDGVPVAWESSDTDILSLIAKVTATAVSSMVSGTGVLPTSIFASRTSTTSTPTHTPISAAGSSSPNTGVKVGIGVGVSIGVLAILGILSWFLWRRRRISTTPQIVELEGSTDAQKYAAGWADNIPKPRLPPQEMAGYREERVELSAEAHR